MTGTDRYRTLTASAVLLVAAIAAVISCQYVVALAIRYGQPALAAYLLPVSIDGLVAVSSLVMLRAARIGVSAPWLARTGLVLAVIATLACNVGYGVAHGRARRTGNGYTRTRGASRAQRSRRPCGRDLLRGSCPRRSAVDPHYPLRPQCRSGQGQSGTGVPAHPEAGEGAMTGQWRWVRGFISYVVSDDGQVASLHHTALRARLLTQTPDRRGYMVVTLALGRKGCKRNRFVHQLVAQSFIGPRPDGKPEVRHLDGDPSNNHAWNLAWGTRAENAQDAVRHGTTAAGSRNGQAKLTEAQVREIRSRYAAGNVTQYELAVEYGVTQPRISNVLNGRNWRHVQ
jgi:hypothetical protein